MISYNQDLNRYEASHEVDLEMQDIFTQGQPWCKSGTCRISEELLAALDAIDQEDQEEF